MAVSPNVDAYMAQTAQQAPSQTAEDTFVREFGNQAFNALRAKYPSIADRVIIFKTLASEMDTSTALRCVHRGIRCRRRLYPVRHGGRIHHLLRNGL